MNKTLKDFKWDTDPNGRAGNNATNVEKVKDLLNSKGCGFCLAKFKQVTMHLGTGMTHACHHPVPHKIPLKEIEENPAALFNTKHLKTARKQMLNDEKPSECDYCWRVEDNDGISDRFYKSLEPWAITDHDEIAQLTGDENIFPSYLEVSFSNACNLACVYCGPEFSSVWVEKLKKSGPMKVLENTEHETWVQGWQDLETLSYKNREFNPYIDAFWKWFPEAYKHLKHYRITGGEPLMSKETFRSMDWFVENPNKDLDFSINSNFMVPDKLWDKFIKALEDMRDSQCVNRITIYTSVEGWGKRAEYARSGLDFELFKKRYEQIVALGDIRCVIMATYNMLSISSIEQLYEWVLDLKMKYNPINAIKQIESDTGFKIDDYSLTDRYKKNPTHSIIVGIDVPYLRNPECLDIKYCSDDLVDEYMIPSLNYMSSHLENARWKNHMGFETYEIEKFRRIVIDRMYFIKKTEPHRNDDLNVMVNRAKFYDYVHEIDRVNGTNFLEVFPEYENFYYICKEAKDKYITSQTTVAEDYTVSEHKL